MKQFTFFINELDHLVMQDQSQNLMEILRGHAIRLGFGRDDEIGILHIGFADMEDYHLKWSEAPKGWELVAKDGGKFLTVIIPGGEDELTAEYVAVPADVAFPEPKAPAKPSKTV